MKTAKWWAENRPNTRLYMNEHTGSIWTHSEAISDGVLDELVEVFPYDDGTPEWGWTE